MEGASESLRRRSAGDHPERHGRRSVTVTLERLDVHVKVYWSSVPLRPGEPRGAGEEANPADHLHGLPAVLCRSFTHPAGERAHRAGGRPSQQQAGSSRGGHLPRGRGHQESPTGPPGEEQSSRPGSGTPLVLFFQKCSITSGLSVFHACCFDFASFAAWSLLSLQIYVEPH